MIKKITCMLIIFMSFSSFTSLQGKELTIESPDGKLNAVITISDIINLKVKKNGDNILDVDSLSLKLRDNYNPGENPKVRRIKSKPVVNEISPVIKEKFAVIKEEYNQLNIDFKGDYSLLIRAYNEGLAYRFVTELSNDITVENENACFSFGDDAKIYFPQEEDFNSHNERPYLYKTTGEINNGDFCSLPALVDLKSGYKVFISESSLEDYPGMWLSKEGNSFKTIFPGYPKSYNPRANPYGRGRVSEYEDYIAKTDGARSFPWRIMAVADNDSQLLTNQLVYLLAPELRLEDTSWIKPGWVTFDWWGRRGIYGVDFKAGVNTETAKYFIDFASKYGIRYFLFDDGWTNNETVLEPVEGLDMEEVMAYSREKGVDIMLWVVCTTFEKEMQEALDLYEKWGVKGLKIDFMQRSDQEMVNFYYKAAEEAAKRKMVIDFHGAYKPSGLRRAYPNVLTREGLIEFEFNGWTSLDNPDHHCTLPFIRNVAGPMDYIPGTMNNAQKKHFRNNGDTPMGQGTRAHSMAMGVICESPMQMLPDSPSDYLREHECTEFITSIPTEWDEIKVIDAKIGDYVVIARRSGNTWYIAAITDWDAREFKIKPDFLDDGIHKIEIFRDGANSATRAIDYKKETGTVSNSDELTISLAPGGGWVGRIEN